MAQTHGGYIANKIVKEPKGFIQNVPSGYFGGYIAKVSSMYPLDNVWTNCLKNLNVSSMYPPGKCPLAPSGSCGPTVWRSSGPEVDVEE